MPDLPAIDWPLEEKAVYWAPPTIDMANRKTYPSPIEIDCRWDEEIVEVLLANKDRYLSYAQIMVDRRLKNQGVLWYGLLADLVNPTDPFLNEGAGVIRKFTRNPSVEADEALYTAYL